MRHLKKGRKFGRTRDQRKALMKSLASSIFMLERIKTTETKAKEVRSLIEKSITRAKDPSLAIIWSLGKIYSPAVVKKILATAQNLKEKKGGYTRVTKLGPRRGDGARMAIIELLNPKS